MTHNLGSTIILFLYVYSGLSLIAVLWIDKLMLEHL